MKTIEISNLAIKALFYLLIGIGGIWLKNTYSIPLSILVATELFLLVVVLLDVAFYRKLFNINKLLLNNNKTLCAAKEKLQSIISYKTMHERETNHELLVPIDNVYGISQLLVDKNISAEMKDKLHIDLRKCTGLLIDYLNYSIQYAKFENEVGPPLALDFFNLRECLEGVLLLLANRTYGLNVKTELTIADNVPINMYSERVTVMQIIGNLLSNAIKFSADKSNPVKLRVSWDNPAVIFIVEDKGKGISEAMLPHIFEPFITTFNEHKAGTGIGLSLTKKHVERLKGTIAVNSVENEGTTFTVNLPLLNK